MTRTPVLEFKRAATPLADLTADGRFSGYASQFGQVDLGRDRVLPGAFAASLARRGAGGVRLLWQHDPAQPIGVWTEIREDARGLFVRGQLATDVEQGREALALIRQGALDGLSIGFRTARAQKNARTGIRDLVEIDLWEISLVTFPMLPDARVGPGAAKAASLAALIRRAARRLAQPAPRFA